jgi:hypothetical protein
MNPNIERECKTPPLIQDDKKISIALMSSFVVLTIQYFILIYFNLVETNTGSYIRLLSKGLVGLTFIYALPAVLRRSKIKFIGVYFVAMFIFLMHYVIFPENRIYIISLLFPLFFMCLPAFIYTLSIREFFIFKEVTRRAGYIVFVVGFLIGVLIFMKKASIGSYSMSLSYYMLLPTLVFFNEIMEKLSIKNFVFFILSMLIILSLGSRGAVLCILLFIFLKFFSPHSKKSFTKIIISFSILGIGIITLIFLDKIIELFYNLLLSYGINSRTLRLFLSGGVYLSGRDRIYGSVIVEILQRPLLGIGIAGDRRFIGGGYAHNLFIEILGNFGIAFGLIISICLLILIIKSLFIKGKENYDLIIMWLSLGFVHLMVSSSYLIDIKFWIFIGLIMNLIKGKKVYNKL